MGGGGLSGPNFVLRDVRTVPYLKFHPHSNWFPSIEVSVVVYMDGRLLKFKDFMPTIFRERLARQTGPQENNICRSSNCIFLWRRGGQKAEAKETLPEEQRVSRKGAGTFHIHRKNMKELGARAFLVVHCLGTTELGTQLC